MIKLSLYVDSIGIDIFLLGYNLKLYIAAIVKDEYSGLLEWIAFHRVLGVDGFIITDNGSRDGSRELLLSLARLGIVTMFDQPTLVNQKPQLPAYEHILRSCPRDIDLLAFIDADEFLLPLESDTKLSDFFLKSFRMRVSALLH